MNFSDKLGISAIEHFLVCSYSIPTDHPLLHPIAINIKDLFENLQVVKKTGGHSAYIQFAWRNYHVIYGIAVADLWLDLLPEGYHPLNFKTMCRLTDHLFHMIQRYE